MNWTKIALIAGLALSGFSATAQKKTKVTTNAKAAVVDVIQWITVEELEQKMKKEPRMVIFDFYTTWCGWCKVMDKKTFANKELAKYVNTHYYAVKFNAESKEPLTFMGKTYEFVPEYRSHRFAAEMMQGKMSYPTVVIAGKNIGFINPFPGYQKLDAMESILRYFNANNIPSQETWDAHSKNYKPSWQETAE